MPEPSVWKWMKTTLLANWRIVTLILCTTFFMAVVSTAFPIIWQMLIDGAVAGSVHQGLSVLFMVLFALEVIPVVHVLRARFMNSYEFTNRYLYFKHLLWLSISFHKEKESAKVILEATKGVSAGNSLIRIFLQGDILSDLPASLFALWYVGSYSITAAVILLLFWGVFLWLSYWIGRKIAKIAEEYNELDNEIIARQREVIQHIEMVKLHKAEIHEAGWYSMQGGNILVIENRLTNYHALFGFMTGLAYSLPFCIALFLFLPQVADGTLTVGTLIALQIFSVRAVAPAGFLGSMYRDIKENIAKLKPALLLLEQQPTVIESQSPLEMKPLRHQIFVQDLVFTYPGQKEPTLKGISLQISAGEKVAFVGETGCGKTTLARMLVRLYDPDHGIIAMDGMDLRHASFHSVYSQISYVMQEIPIFTGTIAENIAYGLSGTKEAELIEACKSASAEFVFDREHGLHAKIGEQGEKLSGGERQRLALARIFLRHPSLVILDEATSSLDQTTEREVQRAFDSLLNVNGGITLVVIAHRIWTVKNADKIVVMHEGRIVDTGTHEELLVRCGLYQELCQGMAE